MFIGINFKTTIDNPKIIPKEKLILELDEKIEGLFAFLGMKYFITASISTNVQIVKNG